jgi:hypothetical protein
LVVLSFKTLGVLDAPNRDMGVFGSMGQAVGRVHNSGHRRRQAPQH